MASLNSYMAAVEKKLQDPAVKRILQFGQTFSDKVTPLRDSAGMAETYNTIMTTAENAFKMLDGQVALGHMFKNFSAGAGYSDVSKVETVGAIDLTILAMSQSLVPFVCVDRGLPTPTSTIYFNNIISNSNNGVGGVNKGDKVYGNFTPPNPNVDLGVPTRSGELAAAGEIDLGSDILAGTVKLEIIDTATGEVKFKGGDFGKDGVIYFNGGEATASVNYETGVIKLSSIGAGLSVKADADLDPTKDMEGVNTLTVIPEWVPVTLETQPLNIILQNNIANMMYIHKTYTNATGSTTSPYNDVLFQRVKNAYIESVNCLILRQLIKSSAAYPALQASLSGYDVNSFANTKNDIVAQLISNMRATLLGRTGCPLTALIVNSNAAAIIEQIPVQFVPNPAINLGINGLIGYFNGIPVFRHNLLDTKFQGYDPGANGILFGVYRNTDNTSGSQVYGEYIPFTSTGNVGNFKMPVQNSTGYFAQVGSKIIQDSLVVKGIIKLNAAGSGDGNAMFTDFTKNA